MCKGNEQDGFSNFTADMGKCIVIIKNVPSRTCIQCGDASYSNEVAQRLEQIVNSLSGPIATEIAVVNYSAQAA
jgi:YgiT-type zinc finger domain-containing protein